MSPTEREKVIAEMRETAEGFFGGSVDAPSLYRQLIGWANRLEADQLVGDLIERENLLADKLTQLADAAEARLADPADSRGGEEYTYSERAAVASAERGLETNRRMAAVELLLDLGYKWDEQKWAAPPSAAVPVATVFLTPDYYGSGNFAELHVQFSHPTDLEIGSKLYLARRSC